MSRKTSYLTVTDQFCGAGGSSIGAAEAGLHIRLALNHWRLAIDTHASRCRVAVHRVEGDQLVPVAERRHGLQPDIPQLPMPHIHHVLYDDDPIAVELGEPNHVPHRGPRALDGRVQRLVVEEVPLPELLPLRPLRQGVVRAFGRGDEDVRRGVPPRVHGGDVVFWRKGNRAPDLEIRPAAPCPKCGEVEAVQTWKQSSRTGLPNDAGRYKRQYVFTCPTCRREVTPYYYAALNAIDWTLPAERIGEIGNAVTPPAMAWLIQRCVESLHPEMAR